MPDPSQAPTPDAALTAQAQLSLERAPYQLRKQIDIPNVKAYRSALPATDAHTQELNPIAGVNQGDTSAVQIYRDGEFQGPDGQDHADQIHAHEAVHMVQNQMPASMTSKFPPIDPRDPYADLRLTTEQLNQMRAQGDTLWDHSAEGQASVVQNYVARHEWLSNQATPQQKQDYMSSSGDYEGAGNAEFEKAYQPYLDDLGNLNLRNHEPMPDTTVGSSALLQAMYTVSGDPADEGTGAQSSGNGAVAIPSNDAAISQSIDAYTQQELQKQNSALQANLAKAAKTDPNLTAEAQQLGLQTGVGPDVAARNMAQVRKMALVQNVGAANLPQTAPRLAKLLQDPNFSGVAYDDLGNLQNIEQGAAALRAQQPGLAAKAGAEIESLGAETDLGFVNSVKPMIDATGDIIQMGIPAIAKSVRALTTRYDWGNLGQQLQDIWTTPQASATQPVTAAVTKRLQGGVIQGGWGRNLVNSVEQVPGMLAAFGLMGRGAGAGAEAADAGEEASAGAEAKSVPAILGTQAAQNTYAEARAKGADQKTAVLSALASGVANYAMMGEIPGAAPAESAPELAGQWAGRSAVMGTGMATVQNAIARSYDPTRSLYEGIPQSIATMAAFEGVGAMGQISDAVEASKLRKRSPQAFQAGMNAMFEGDPSVRIPAEDFVNYFHGKNIDPAAMANRVGVSNLEEAAAAGSDLEIPTANFFGKLDPEHQKGLLPDVVDPGNGMTARQSEAGKQELQDWIDNGGAAKLQAEYEQADAETQATPEWKSVYSDLKQRYLDAGEKDNAADSYATLQANAIANLAKQSGMKPDELLALHNPKIVAAEAPDASRILNQMPLEEGAGDKGTQPTQETPAGARSPKSEQRPPRPGDVLYHVAGNKWKAGSDLLSFDDLRDAGIGYKWKWDAPDADHSAHLVSLEPYFKKAVDFSEHFGGSVLRVHIPEDADLSDMEAAVNIEGYPTLKTVPAGWLQKVPKRELEGVRQTLKAERDAVMNAARDAKATAHAHFLSTLTSEERERVPKTYAEWRQAADRIWETYREATKDIFKIPQYHLDPTLNAKVDAAVAVREKAATAIGPEPPRVAGANRDSDQSTSPNSGEDVLHQASAADEPRGWFRMKPDGSYEIGKTKIGDMSTLIHEPAHAYLELFRELTGREGASEGLQEDFKKITAWLGTTPEEARANGFTREQHEQWARANEQYVREGKAPTAGLRRAFHNFAVWLGSIYQRATDLNVEVSPEIRGVMDRLYAGEGAVERAERQTGEPLFKSPEEAGWTDDQYRNYADAHGIAGDKAREQVSAEMNAAAEREKTQQFREEKRNVHDAVSEEIDARPEYTAIRSLRRGKLDDGTEVTLSRQAMVDQFGEDRVKALQKLHPGLYRQAGGLDADTAAELFGFHSGEEMLRALEAAPRRNQAIEAATRDFLVNKYGDVRYDGTLNDRARFAIENNERAANLYKELRALKTRLASVEKKAADTKASMAGIALPPLEHYEAAAHDMIQSKAIADIQPYRYLNASRKFSRDAFEAAGKGDARRAFEAKNKELLNHFLFREAMDAQEYAGKFESYAKRVQSRGVQQRMGLAGSDTRDQFNWLLARYKLGGGPEPQRSLRDWADEMYGDMYEPAITPGILNGSDIKDYRSVPLSEVQQLHDALQNIRHLAQMQYKVYINGKMEDFAERRTALVNTAREKLPSKPVPVLEKDYAGKWAAKIVRGVDVDNTRMEFLINKLDGGTRGPWHDNLWNPYQDAKGDEHALAEQVTSKILDAMDRQTEKSGLRMLDKVMVDGIPTSETVNRKDLVSMAMNLGNAGNLDRLRRSFSFHGWDPAAIPEIAKMVTPDQWDFVQDLWDALKPIGERMEKLEKRQTGLPPTMVKVEPFTVHYDDGTEKNVSGGYYPIQIDPAYSLKGYQEDAIKSAANLMEKGYGRATTSRGYTKERTGFGGPLLFDYERVLSSHLTKAIKDITHREFMQAANKFLLDPEVRQTLRETVGPTYEQSMMPWLRAVVNDRNGTLDRGANDPRPWIEKVRSNLIRAGLTFKVSTGLEQISHLPTVFLYTKKASYGRALLDFWKDPAGTTEAIRELSPNVMRFRGEDLGRDYNTAIRDIANKKSIGAQVGRLGMAAYKYNDHIWSFPLWNSVYRESLLKDPMLPESESHALAVHDADAAVRMALGVGDTGDQAPIMRSQDMLTRWATTMFGFENLRYNIMRHDIGDRTMQRYRVGDVVGAGKILTAGAIAGLILPALQGSLATGNGPKKDENPAEWAITRSLLFTGSTIPWVRNILSQFEYGTPTMAESFLKRGVDVLKGATSNKEDKDWTGLGINALQFGGDVTGVPGTNQAAQTARYVHRASQGKIENPTIMGAVVGGGHK